MPIVSVIIPTFNRSQLLKQTIDSVLAQTWANFEIILVDDGSKDDTIKIVNGFQDSRIYYNYQENSGLATARNKGIQLAQGEYIAFLDDDDLWLPDKLSYQMQIFEKNPQVGFVTCGYQTINNQGKFMSKVTPWIWRPQLDLKTWLTSCPTVPSAVVVRREWLESVGYFDEKISQLKYGAEDWDLWLRMSYAGCLMAWAEKVLCVYRIHPGSMAHNAQRQRSGILFVLDKFFERSNLTRDLYEEKNHIYSLAYLRTAARLYAFNQVEMAENDVAHAIQINPRLLENNGEILFKSLVGWANDPIVDNAQYYLERVFNHLPDAALVIIKRKREAIGLAAKGSFFNAHLEKDWKKVRQCLLKIALTRPSLLLDRGVASVVLKMIHGN